MLIYYFFKDLINIKINYDIGKKTWFGTGGKAQILLVINNLKSLQFLLKILPKSHPIFLNTYLYGRYEYCESIALPDTTIFIDSFGIFIDKSTATLFQINRGLELLTNLLLDVLALSRVYPSSP